MNNIVAIVGRPNVGKSTLFNRLIERKEAIIHETPGVTRDRHYGLSEWNGQSFSVIDTGGYVIGSEDIFEKEIRKQVEIALEEAGVILFVVDVETGPTDLDKEVAKMLRRTTKPVFLVANKADNSSRYMDANEFYELGLETIYPLSAINGSGTSELLDDVVDALSQKEENPETTEEIPRLAFIGRPNVGKSTLINTLIGEERNIVTPISGTTRDPILSRYNKYQHDFFLIDTAVLRKKIAKVWLYWSINGIWLKRKPTPLKNIPKA